MRKFRAFLEKFGLVWRVMFPSHFSDKHLYRHICKTTSWQRRVVFARVVFWKLSCFHYQLFVSSIAIYRFFQLTDQNPVQESTFNSGWLSAGRTNIPVSLQTWMDLSAVFPQMSHLILTRRRVKCSRSSFLSKGWGVLCGYTPAVHRVPKRVCSTRAWTPSDWTSDNITITAEFPPIRIRVAVWSDTWDEPDDFIAITGSR